MRGYALNDGEYTVYIQLIRQIDEHRLLVSPVMRAITTARNLRLRPLQGQKRRCYASVASSVNRSDQSDVESAIRTSSTKQKKGGTGTIEDIFTSFTRPGPPLPQRFSDLKKALFTDQLVHSWREVLDELATETEEVAARGADVSFFPRCYWFKVHVTAYLNLVPASYEARN